MTQEQELSERSNFYASIDTRLRRQEIARLFVASGWSTRKCGFHEYELGSDFAELVLEADGPFLLHGLVRDVLTNAHQIATVLRKADIQFVLECYSEDGTLMAEIRA